MSAILNLVILDLAIIVFPLKITHTCQDWFPPFAQKKTSIIHSDSGWWWQPSWILPCFQDSDTLLSSLRFTQKHSHPLWLWLKLFNLTQTHSFSLNLIGSHLEFCHEFCLDSAILVFPLKLTHTLPRLVPTICTKKNFTHSFWLNLISHLEFCNAGFRHCHLGFRHLVISPLSDSQKLSLYSDSDSN